MSGSFYQEIGYTGRHRWTMRKRWFRKPIKVEQVEVRTLVTDNYNAGIDTDYVNIWRDMRLEDVGFWRLGS